MIKLEYIVKKVGDKIEAYPQLKVTIPVTTFFLAFAGWFILSPSSFHQAYYYIHGAVENNFIFILIISVLLIILSIVQKIKILSTVFMFAGFIGFGLTILLFYQQSRISEPKIGVLSNESNTAVASEVRTFVQEQLKNTNDIDIKLITYSTNNTVSDIKKRLDQIRNDNLDILIIDLYLPISNISIDEINKLTNPYTLYLFTRPFKRETLLEFENFLNVSSSIRNQVYQLAKNNPITKDTAYYFVDNDFLGEKTAKTIEQIYRKLGNSSTYFKKLSNRQEIPYLNEDDILLFFEWDDFEINIPPSKKNKILLMTHSEAISNQNVLTPTLEHIFFDNTDIKASGAKLAVTKEIMKKFYDRGRPLSFSEFNKEISPDLFEKFFVELNQSGEVIYKHR